jgi:hypothetical protein
VAIVAVVSTAALAPVAAALLALGLVLYVRRIAGFDAAELRIGAGDIWVRMGALAISALAAADLAARVGEEALRVLALVLWAAATGWIPPLVAAELRWPRRRFEPKRWSTVFPLGMYATASAAAGRTIEVGGLGQVSRVFLFIAFCHLAARRDRRRPVRLDRRRLLAAGGVDADVKRAAATQGGCEHFPRHYLEGADKRFRACAQPPRRPVIRFCRTRTP